MNAVYFLIGPFVITTAALCFILYAQNADTLIDDTQITEGEHAIAVEKPAETRLAEARQAVRHFLDERLRTKLAIEREKQFTETQPTKPQAMSEQD